MDVLRCVNCPLKRVDGTLGRMLVCEIEGNEIDLTNLVLLSPKDLDAVTCSQDLDAVVREAQTRINVLHGVIERAINFKTERDDWPAHLEKPTEEDIKFLAELDGKD